MTDKKYKIAGSILSADLLNLGKDVEEAVNAGVDIIHFDVMDYHFVPNLTFGPAFLKALRKKFPEVVFDVHLMVSPITDNIIEDFAKAGASWISFHPEACVHAERMLTRIQELGCKAGLALNPSTSPQFLRYLWKKLDFVLVMSVNPGFGGQSCLDSCVLKVRDVRRLAAEADVKAVIEVDGGGKADNIASIADAGATVFVVGSAFFGAEDKAKALYDLHLGLGE